MVDIVADISELLGSSDDSNSCNQCTKSFSNQRLLIQHQQMFHTDKSFVCEICGKAFRFRSNLAEHRSVHTALKPYVCKFCGKSSRLKGNLTKHIQKHHKKESSECIGKDDIIVKKDNSAENYLDNSMGSHEEIPLSMLPKEETNDHERSILISLGLDYNGSIDLRDESPEPSASPDNTETNASPSMFKSDYVESEASYGSPMQTSTVGGETSLAALIACVGTPPQATTPIQNNNKTKCELCGKHFRKREQMTMHMTINHGFPPPESTASSEGKISEAEPMETEPQTTPSWMQQELKNMKNMVEEMKQKYEKDSGINKVEQLLGNMDARVGRLEKQLEMALNSIYTLVQLQTGMNSNVTRFREEAGEQLKNVHQLLKDHNEST